MGKNPLTNAIALIAMLSLVIMAVLLFFKAVTVTDAGVLLGFIVTFLSGLGFLAAKDHNTTGK